MASKNAWKIGLSLALLTAVAVPGVARATCPATCPVMTSTHFTQVLLSNPETELVQGGTGLTEDHPRGNNIYRLAVTAEHAAKSARALSAKCPVTVYYSTRGDLLRSGAGFSRFFADIQTAVYKSTFGQILDTNRVLGEAPPLTSGNYMEDHTVTVGTSLAAGDTLAVDAVAGADAEAGGPAGIDQASAHFRMYPGGTSGSPLLEICTK